MASGSAPSGQASVKIRPLQPEDDVPRGRQGDWLGSHNSK